jgi:hypothetical protein
MIGVPILLVAAFVAALFGHGFVKQFLMERHGARIEEGLAHIADTGRAYEPWLRYDLVCFATASQACRGFQEAATKAGRTLKDANGCCSISGSNTAYAVGYVRSSELNCVLINKPSQETDGKFCYKPSSIQVRREMRRENPPGSMERTELREYFLISQRADE